MIDTTMGKSLRCDKPSSVEISASVPVKKIFSGLSCGNYGHVTRVIYPNFPRTPIKFGFDRPTVF